MSPSNTVSSRESWLDEYVIVEAHRPDVSLDPDSVTPGVSIINQIEQNNTIETGHTLATRPETEDARGDELPSELHGRLDLRPPLDDVIREWLHQVQREDAACVTEQLRRTLLRRRELAAQGRLGPQPQGHTGGQNVSAADVSTICFKVNKFIASYQDPGPNTTRLLHDIGRSSHRPREKLGPANLSWRARIRSEEAVLVQLPGL
jgi:hypothetical protein